MGWPVKQNGREYVPAAAACPVTPALREGVFPRALRRGLGIFGGAVLEEVGVLDAVQDGVQPRQRVLLDAVHRLQAELQQAARSEEHTSELQSLMRISYAVFCLKKKNNNLIRHNL